MCQPREKGNTSMCKSDDTQPAYHHLRPPLKILGGLYKRVPKNYLARAPLVSATSFDALLGLAHKIGYHYLDGFLSIDPFIAQ